MLTHAARERDRRSSSARRRPPTRCSTSNGPGRRAARRLADAEDDRVRHAARDQQHTIPPKDKITLDVDKLDIDDAEGRHQRHDEDARGDRSARRRAQEDRLLQEDVDPRPDRDRRRTASRSSSSRSPRSACEVADVDHLAIRARDFWDRISPRERRLVVIARDRRADHDRDLARPRDPRRPRRHGDAQRQDAQGARSSLADLQARGAERAGRRRGRRRWATEPLSLETYLDNAAQKAGFVLKGTHAAHTRSPRNGFVTNSVVVSALATSRSISSRSSSRRSRPSRRYVAVTHLEIQRRDFQDKDKLDAHARGLDVREGAPPKAEGSGSAGSGSGSDKKGG